MSVHTLLILFVIIQRLAELVISKRNTRHLLSKGAKEYYPGHYKVMVFLHISWILTVAYYGRSAEPQPLFIVLFLGLQPLRYWCLITLGQYWTTRIIRLPSAPLIRQGPYRYISHPNYLVVVLEMALFPLCFNLLSISVLFSLANAALIYYRITKEEEVLSWQS